MCYVLDKKEINLPKRTKVHKNLGRSFKTVTSISRTIPGHLGLLVKSFTLYPNYLGLSVFPNCILLKGRVPYLFVFSLKSTVSVSNM